MKNLVQPGRTITVTAPANVESGEGVLIGQLFGVCAGDAASGATLDLVTEGVFDLAKATADIFTVGAPVYWDAELKKARSGNDEDSNSAGANEALIGVAVAVAGAGASTVRVKLGQPVTLV
jgi:predicted RecA/RadA family phage recombinase